MSAQFELEAAELHHAVTAVTPSVKFQRDARFMMVHAHQKSNELAKWSIDLCWESLLDKATRSAVCQRGKSFARLFSAMHNCDLRCFKDFAVRLVRTALKSSPACLPIAENFEFWKL